MLEFGDYESPTVVLVHGLARSRLSMAGLQLYLWAKGMRVLNFGYPSRRLTVREAAGRLDKFLTRKLYSSRLYSSENQPTAPLYFVTHSLGSIVVRQLLHEARARYQVSRVVMIGPPNQGSVLAALLVRWRFFRWLYGPVLTELANLDVPLSTDCCEIGVIAGVRAVPRYLLPFFYGDNDGIVSLVETGLPGASGQSTVWGTHMTLMWQPSCLRLVHRFLTTGAFNPEACSDNDALGVRENDEK